MATKYFPTTLYKMLEDVELKVYLIEGRPLPEFSAEGELLAREKTYRIRGLYKSSSYSLNDIKAYVTEPAGDGFTKRGGGYHGDKEMVDVFSIRPTRVGVAKFNPHSRKSEFEFFDDVEILRRKFGINSEKPEDVEKAKDNKNLFSILEDSRFPTTSRSRNSTFNPIYAPDTVRRVKDSIAGAKEWNYKNTGSHHTPYGNLSAKNYGDTILNAHKIKLPLIIEKHPENINGIIIYQMECLVSWPDVEKAPTWEFNVISYYEIIPGKGNSKAWKNLKRGPVEKDFQMFVDMSDPSLWFEGCTEDNDVNRKLFYISKPKQCEISSIFSKEELYKFFREFPNFTKMTGFEEAALATTWNTTSFFVKYCYLVSTYPIIEQLIKMGYWSVFIETLNKCENFSKKDRRDFLNSLSKIIDEDATSGKKALKLPSYISKYISSHSVGIDEMTAWYHLHEAVNFSKDYFEVLTENSYFKLLQIKLNKTALIQDLAKIAVFGYEPAKTLNYVVRQSQKYSERVDHCFRNLIDYARMCDVMGVAPDMYPDNIVKVHDSMSTQFKAFQSAALDGNIAAVKEKLAPAVEALKELKTYRESGMTILVPGSSYDIIKEGQQQRNCVGSYVRSVAEGSSIVFFIRESDSPDESFVTAEYRNGYLSQCYYAANRYVPEDTVEHKIAVMFANELKRRGITTK